METEQPERGTQVRRVIVIATAVVAFLSILYELLLAGHGIGDGLAHSILPIALLIAAAWEYFHGMRTELIMLLVAGAYGVLGVVDPLLDASLTTFDPTMTLAVLIMVSVIYVATRTRQTLAPVVAMATFIGLYSIGVILLNDYPTDQAIAILILGIPGQAMVLWMIHRLIKTLADTSATESKQARIQRALARCSEALLRRGTDDPLRTALHALLDATEADYAYIDINRVDSSGHYTWDIIADAASDRYPGKHIGFTSGDYEGLEFVSERLTAGSPAMIVTTELEEPVRSQYEAEGIKAELAAPIRIGERWLGTIGYTDHLRDGGWTEVEIEGLMRAAEMVAAYWDREAAREGLMELAHAKDRFIATVSHELRTPLTAVVGFAAELVEGAGTLEGDEVGELASVIHDQSVEVAQLVDDLLTAERAASGNLTVKPGAIPLLKECLDLVDATTVGREINVVGEDVMAWADPLRTRQIIRNLLTNAVRHGGEAIVVEVGHNGQSSRVQVKDNGDGVSGIDADRIFEAYYRANNGQTVPDSVGLGLAVCRQLAGLMDGDITYARADGWTSFELTLPLADGVPS